MNLLRFFQKMVSLLEPAYKCNENSILSRYLGWPHIYVLKSIVKKYDVQIAGSISLIYAGLLNRPVGDIDLIVTKSVARKMMADKDLKLSTQGVKKRTLYYASTITTIDYETFLSLDGIKIKRIGLVHLHTNLKVCLFILDRMPKNPSYHRFLDMDLMISPVNDAIRAKIAYATHNDKHKVDLENINNILENAFFLATNKPL